MKIEDIVEELVRIELVEDGVEGMGDLYRVVIDAEEDRDLGTFSTIARAREVRDAWLSLVCRVYHGAFMSMASDVERLRYFEEPKNSEATDEPLTAHPAFNMTEKQKPARIGFTAGSFDLLHDGHLQMLEEAREQCDVLVALVQRDPSIDRPEKNRPVVPFAERVRLVGSLRMVDEVVGYTTEADLRREIACLWDGACEDYGKNVQVVRIIGADWEGKDFTGKTLCERLGIEIYFNSRNHSMSSSQRRREVAEASLPTLKSEIEELENLARLDFQQRRTLRGAYNERGEWLDASFSYPGLAYMALAARALCVSEGVRENGHRNDGRMRIRICYPRLTDLGIRVRDRLIEGDY